MRMLRFALALLATFAFAPVPPADAQVLGVPRSFVPTICGGATIPSAQVCLNDGNGQTLPWGRINSSTHTFQPMGDASGLTLGMPDGSSQSMSALQERKLVAPTPDTAQGYFTVTTVAGSPNIKIGGANFTSALAGKYMTVHGAGPNDWRLIGKVVSVTDPTDVVLSANATQSMTAVSQQVEYGSDQWPIDQPLINLARTLNVPFEFPPGNYLLSQGLQCAPPNNSFAYANGFNLSSNLCPLQQGARLVAMAPMQAVITYGGIASDYSQVLRSAIFGGGTVDGNFIATECVDVPFYVVATRKDQLTKNCLAGVKWGSLTAPTNSGGALDFGISHLRDTAYVTITGISNSNPAVVTCQWDCGVPTGRVITPIGIAGSMGIYLNLKYFEVTAIDATHFSLNNTDSTGWGAFTSGRYAMAMRGMHVLHPVYSVTNANPAVFSTDTHHFTNGQQVFVSDVGSMPMVDGIYTVQGCTANTCQLPGLDTTNAPAFTGGGTVLTWDDPTTTVRGISYENASDSDVDNAQISGVRWGIYAGAASGYDGKVHRIHVYNYDEAGQVFAATSVGGDYTLDDVQCDAPVHFCYRFTGPRNTMLGARMDYAGGVALNNNYDSFVRFEAGGSVNVIGGSVKGQAGASVYRTVSAADRTQYGQFLLDAINVFAAQPDTIDSGSLLVTNKNGGNASALVKGPNNTTLGLCDTTAGHNGLYFSTLAGATALAVYDSTCAYAGTVMTLSPTQVAVNVPIAMTGGNASVTNSGGGNATMSVRGANNTTSYICDTTPGHNGIYFSTVAGGTNLAMLDSNCNYVSTGMIFGTDRITPTQPLMATNFPTTCTISGSLYRDTTTSPATVRICP